MKVKNLIDKYQKSEDFDAESPGIAVILDSLSRIRKHVGNEHPSDLRVDRLTEYVRLVVGSGTSVTSAQMDLSLLGTLATLDQVRLAPVRDVMDAYQPKTRNLGPVYERVTVHPGDFGKRFQTVDNASRGVDKGWAKKLYAQWNTVVPETILVLYRDPNNPDVFRIVDGQHRIYAASELCDVPTTFEAQIRTSEPIGVVDQIANLNLGKRYRTQDHLMNAREESWWPSVFKAHGLEPSFIRSGPRMNWPAVIGGLIVADGRPSGFATSPPAQLEVWRTRDADVLSEIDECAKVLTWWKPACDGASTAHKLYTLQSVMGVAFAIRLWRENRHVSILAGAPQRLLTWPELPSIRGFTTARGVMLFDLLLKGVNYRMHKDRCLSVGGRTGNEEVGI